MTQGAVGDAKFTPLTPGAVADELDTLAQQRWAKLYEHDLAFKRYADILRSQAETIAALEQEVAALVEGIRNLHSGTGEDGEPCLYCKLARYT